MDKGKGKALSVLLSQYLNQLCASNTVLLQAHGSYSSQLYPNLEAVIQPVFLQTKQPVCSETIKTLARAWTEQLLKWTQADGEKTFYKRGRYHTVLILISY